MKTWTAIPVNMAGSGTIRQPGTVRYGIASRRGLRKRFEHFIEKTDWDERYVCNRLIDKLCLGGIVLTASYFFPILSAFLRK
jgi:hypothetical protein